jgi:hypothetical protein
MTLFYAVKNKKAAIKAEKAAIKAAFLLKEKITSFLQQQAQLVQQQLVLQQQERQQQELQQVQEQQLLLSYRKQPEPEPAGKRSATIFS